MTTPDDTPFLVSDDALAAMLRERASRVPATADTTVMARVHAEIAKPRANNLFAFLPIGERAGSMSGLAGWAVAIAAAVVVIAVLGGRNPDGPASTPGSSAAPGVTLATLPPLGSPEPGASGIPGASVGPQWPVHGRPMSGLALKDALADGSLDGGLVVVDGQLSSGNVVCAEGPCEELDFIGLQGVHVAWNGPMPPVDLTYPVGTAVPGANEWWSGPFLVRPSGAHLELLGRLVGDLSNPVSVQTALVDRRGYPNASSPFDVLAVQGWLVDGCRALPAGTICDGVGPLLADAWPNGGRGSGGGEGQVMVTTDAFGLSDESVVEGPFLVRFEQVPDACPRLALCLGPGWGANPTVLGRYDANQVVEVVLP